MAREVTHRGDIQIVSAARLRDILVADGEACLCAPDASIEWDAGPCPIHDDDVRVQARRALQEAS